jgi:hypothetical protein
MVNQAEVDRANFAGRLHPSQRGKVLDGTFWTGLLLVVAAVYVLAIAPKEPGAAVFLVYMSPVLLLLAFGLWLCVRRLLDLFQAKLVLFTGWTHDDGHHVGRQRAAGYPIVVYTTRSNGGTTHYNVRVGNRGFGRIDKKLNSRIQPERSNTVFMTPRAKQLINVAPTP